MDKMLPFEIELGVSRNNNYPYNIIPVGVAKEERIPVIVLTVNCDDFKTILAQNRFLVLNCKAVMKSSLRICAVFYKSKTPVFRMTNTMIGGREVHCCFDLSNLDSSRVYPRNLPGHLKCMANGKPTDIKCIDQIKLEIYSGKNFECIDLYGIEITNALPSLEINGAPLVDQFGQSTEKNWEGKVNTAEELSAFLKQEYQWAQDNINYVNEAYDQYGGWKKLSFEAKGYFYCHNDGNRYWLVDPEGNAFFSNGVCYGNRTGIYGVVDSMENLFEDLPSMNGPELGCAWTTANKIPEYVRRNGNECNNKRYLFNFARANMIRAFGKDKWLKAWITINTARFRKWGFNTISIGINEYSDEYTTEYIEKARIPYCITLKNFPKTKNLIFRDFPDVFNDEYEKLCTQYAQQIIPFCKDQFFIGFFLNNEPEWMFQPDVNLAERVFASKQLTKTKIELINFLTAKYTDINMLNRKWNTNFTRFCELENPLNSLNFSNESVREDFGLLQKIMIEKYTSVPTECLHKLAPHALNMGMRYSYFSGANFDLNYDVFSFNCYSKDPSKQFERVETTFNSPFLIGEWHIGSSESGLMSNALVNALTQEERGKACAEYLRKAFLSKKCVGAHYFEWNDQPYLGRFDGENMQIGLIDVCNRPYYDCVKTISKINSQMYQILNGDNSVEEIKWEHECRY